MGSFSPGTNGVGGLSDILLLMVQKSCTTWDVKVTFLKNPCKKMGIFSISTVVSHGCFVFLSLSPFISFMPSSMSWLWRCFLEGLQTDSSHSDIETGINAGVVAVVVVVVGCLLLYRLPHKSTDKTTSKLGGGFKYFVFSPRTLGKGSTSSHIFQMGWFNHQPGKVGVVFHPNRKCHPFWEVHAPLFPTKKPSMGRTVYLPYIWLKFVVNVGKYNIHGLFGY